MPNTQYTAIGKAVMFRTGALTDLPYRTMFSFSLQQDMGSTPSGCIELGVSDDYGNLPATPFRDSLSATYNLLGARTATVSIFVQSSCYGGMLPDTSAIAVAVGTAVIMVRNQGFREFQSLADQIHGMNSPWQLLLVQNNH